LNETEPNWAELIADCFHRPHADAPLHRFLAAVLPYARAALTSRQVDLALVDDALQSAVLKYFHIFQHTPPRPLNIGYFIVVAKNCLVDELRKRKGQVPLDELAEEVLSTAPVATEDADDRMLLVQYALARMDPRCRFILERYYIDEMNSRRLADFLRIGPDSVHMAIKRCRDRLRDELQRLMES
jgi:RNA polymerase sigma factor (sigma-70 family)